MICQELCPVVRFAQWYVSRAYAKVGFNIKRKCLGFLSLLLMKYQESQIHPSPLFLNTPGHKYMLGKKIIIIRHLYDYRLLDCKSFLGKMT